MLSVGRNISDVGERETPGYRRECQESLRQKGIDIFMDMEGFWPGDDCRIIAAMLLFTLQLEALEITPTSPLVPYINWLYPRTQAEF